MLPYALLVQDAFVRSKSPASHLVEVMSDIQIGALRNRSADITPSATSWLSKSFIGHGMLTKRLRNLVCLTANWSSGWSYPEVSAPSDLQSAAQGLRLPFRLQGYGEWIVRPKSDLLGWLWRNSQGVPNLCWPYPLTETYSVRTAHHTVTTFFRNDQ